METAFDKHLGTRHYSRWSFRNKDKRKHHHPVSGRLPYPGHVKCHRMGIELRHGIDCRSRFHAEHIPGKGNILHSFRPAVMFVKIFLSHHLKTDVSTDFTILAHDKGCSIAVLVIRKFNL